MSRLRRVFASNDRRFFDLFEESATNALRTAQLLDEMLETYPERPDLAREILRCEQEGDRITYDIIQRLNATSIPPIDRQDILRLASGLDDIVDLTEEATDYLVLYKIEAPMEQSQRLAQILLAACQQIAAAMPSLRGFEDLTAYTAEVHRLETEGDKVTREAVASLFDTGIDPMVVIRWKDIFERLEDAIDATELVANQLANIVARNS